MTRVLVNGVDYHVERTGSGPALVLLHGFTGSTATWAPHIPVFARDFQTVAIDFLGHGASAVPADPARYRLERTVADLTALLDELGITRAVWLGYSMGGRVALGVAAAQPAMVEALVLESAGPGIADPAERAARAEADEQLADVIEQEGMETFVDRWERLPLFASHARLPASTRAALRGQRLANIPVGLANSLRGLGQGAQPPLHDRLAGVEVPTLFVVGEEDTKYRRFADESAATMPRAQIAVVAGSGHAPHLEQPEVFRRVVLDFLGSLRR